jgi:hypothetical protein
MSRNPAAEAAEHLRHAGHRDLAQELECYNAERNMALAEGRDYARRVAELLEEGPPQSEDTNESWKNWAHSCAKGIRRYILGEKVDMGEGPLH